MTLLDERPATSFSAPRSTFAPAPPERRGAAVEHYAGWGLYSASKAGLDHITLTFAAENPEITAYAVDPGDMRTQMHQDWFPGEDISDRPLPETVVPHLLALLASRPPSGRYRAADFPALRTTTEAQLGAVV